MSYEMETTETPPAGPVARLRASLGDLPSDLRQLGERLLRFGPTERLEWYDNMTTMLSGGVKTDQALADIEAVNRRLGKGCANAYESMLLVFRSGAGIAAAAKPWVPATELVLLNAVQKTSQPEGYRCAALLLEGRRAMQLALATAFAYPLVLFIAMCISITQMGDKFLPAVSTLSVFKTLPNDLAMYAAFVKFMAANQVTMGIVIATLAAVIVASFAHWNGNGRQYADRFVPPYILYRLYCAAVFVLSLGALLRAGMTLDNALRGVAEHSNGYLRRHVERVLLSYREADHNTDAFDTGLLPPSVLVRITALSRVGGMGPALTRAGETIVELSIRTMKRGSAALSGAVVLGIVIFIGYTLKFINVLGAAGATGH